MAPKIIPQGDPTLPPAGDERREVLAERADTLAEAAETAGADRGTIDPRAFRIENEIGQHFNDLDVPNARAGSRYCWVQAGPSWHGRFINMKRAEGWEVVRGSDDDAPIDTVAPDNTCRVADVLLMRISTDRYIEILKRRQLRQRSIELGSLEAAALEAESEKYAKLGIKVGLADPNRMKTMTARARGAMIAQQKFEQSIKDGTLPGVPAGGARGR